MNSGISRYCWCGAVTAGTVMGMSLCADHLEQAGFGVIKVPRYRDIAREAASGDTQSDEPSIKWDIKTIRHVVRFGHGARLTAMLPRVFEGEAARTADDEFLRSIGIMS